MCLRSTVLKNNDVVAVDGLGRIVKLVVTMGMCCRCSWSVLELVGKAQIVRLALTEETRYNYWTFPAYLIGVVQIATLVVMEEKQHIHLRTGSEASGLVHIRQSSYPEEVPVRH